MSISNKKEHLRSWPRSLYLEDEDRTDHQYQQFQSEWEQGQSVQGFNIFDSLSPRSGYRPLNDSPQFLNLSPPPEPFMLRHARKDPYEKSRARYESKPKLGTIPERGAKGIAAAGRYPGTLTASEIAEVDSHFGQSKVTLNSNGGIATSELGRGDVKSRVSGFDAPPSYKSDDTNNNWWGRKKRSPHKMKICIGVIVTLVLIGLVISAVAIYFSLAARNSSEDNSNAVRYELTMKLDNANFSVDLLNNKSSRFLKFQKHICDTMTGILSDISLCQLDACRKGSVIADFTLGVPKQTSQGFEQNNVGKYSDFMIAAITKAWADPNSPDNVLQFVDIYGPVPQSLEIVNNPQATDPATPVATMTSPITITSTVQNTQTSRATENHVTTIRPHTSPYTISPYVTTSSPRSTHTHTTETTTASRELTTSTSTEHPPTTSSTTMSSITEPSSRATSTLSSTTALIDSSSLSTSSAALTFESSTVLSTDATTLHSTTPRSTTALTSTGETISSSATTVMSNTDSISAATSADAPTSTDPTYMAPSTHALSTTAQTGPTVSMTIS